MGRIFTKPVTKALGGWAACLGGAVAAACLALIFTNLPTLIHTDERVMRTISPDEAVIVESDGGAADIVFAEPGGVYIHKLIFDMPGDVSAPRSIYVTASLNDGSVFTYEDTNPIYVSTEVVDMDLSGVESVHIEGAYGAVGFRVDNSLDRNLAALIFAALFGGALMKLIIYRPLMRTRPETAFLTIALVSGLSMVLSLPATKVSYDEETHLQAVMALAAFPETELHISREALYQITVTVYNDPDALPGGSEETKELETRLDSLCDYREGGTTPTLSVPLSRVPAYITMAIGARIAAIMGLSWTGMYRVIRLFNLITYVILMYMAIHIVPRGKYLMMFIGLLPEVLFMASACSYDPFIIGILCLGTALAMRGEKYLIPALICIVLGCLPKAVYAPLALTPIVFSLGRKRFEIRGSRKLVAGVLAAAVFIALISVFILPTVLSPPDTGDVRGGAVSELSQVSFILSHPLAYAGILISSAISWIPQCWFGPDCFTFMGHLVNGSTAFKGYYHLYMVLIVMLLIVSYLGEKAPVISERGVRVTPAVRSGLIVIVIVSSALIWTAMYVAFTEPGAAGIAGVQGRYFIPLMFPLYVALSGDGRLEERGALCYDLFEFIELFALFLVIWRVVVGVFGV